MKYPSWRIQWKENRKIWTEPQGPIKYEKIKNTCYWSPRIRTRDQDNLFEEKCQKKKIPQIQLKEIIKESLWTPNRIKIKEKNTNAYHNQANQIQGKETILKADRESDIYREWFQ